MSKKLILVCAAVLCVGAFVLLEFFSPTEPASREGTAPAEQAATAPQTAAKPGPAQIAATSPTKPSVSRTQEGEEDEAEAEEPLSEEDAKAAEEEKRVEDFDALTDRWMEPAPADKPVTMADVDAFVAQFAKVPKDRKEECLQRALNLVPDENVMLLAGVLMDKSQPKELVELVFNDILNRDESVKEPILKQVYADKTHPCWADTAWILDVTGAADSSK